MKKIIKKIIPKSLFNLYHLAWAFFSALYFAFPSKGMVVIGVTGTKGKSSSVYMLSKVLDSAGLDVAVSSSLIFKIKKEEWVNPYHMTMVGRFRLQKFLKNAKDQGCKYVIIEVTSEGIMQSRHRLIDFDIAIFTNLSEEHLEAHGGFDNYKKAKGELFASLGKSKRKIIDGEKIKKVIIANTDDANSEYFLNFNADKKIGFALNKSCNKSYLDKCFIASSVNLESGGSSFSLNEQSFKMKLFGEFNIYNALSVVSCADTLGLSLKDTKSAIESIEEIPGRVEFIKAGQKFKAIVDLAHTPSSFDAIFKAVNLIKNNNSRVISVFGSAGGGRDKWKRSELGKIAAQNSDIIILTNEDPYDEDSSGIISDIKKGILNESFSGDLSVIQDREQAIEKAVLIAKDNDVLLFLGKGTERTMVVGEKTISWNEEELVKSKINEYKK